MNDRIQIVGIGDDGYDGLTGQARQLVQSATKLIGTPDLLRQIPPTRGQRVVIDGDLHDLRRVIDECAASTREDVPAADNRRKSEESQDPQASTGGPVLLASGDPLFYGITRFLFESVGKEKFVVVPHVSSMQLAFARVKESWDDAYLASLATESLDRVVDRVRTAERVGLFTTEAASPAVVASALLDRRIDYFTAYVCEDLGTPAETVTQGSLQSIVGQTFSSLNVMVLVRQSGAADRPASGRRRLFGNPDDWFVQSRPKRGLITPQEVRCIALAELAIHPDSVVWDVGAGSGSLAIEAAALASAGSVYAIEMDAEDYNLMIENARQMESKTLVPIHGRAPDAFGELPDPDAIFVGGSGRMVPEITRAAAERLKPNGRLVVNVNSLENLLQVQQVLQQSGWQTDVRMINIARGCHQLERVKFEALDPTFLILADRST